MVDKTTAMYINIQIYKRIVLQSQKIFFTTDAKINFCLYDSHVTYTGQFKRAGCLWLFLDNIHLLEKGFV